jgi:hypothetical protein
MSDKSTVVAGSILLLSRLALDFALAIIASVVLSRMAAFADDARAAPPNDNMDVKNCFLSIGYSFNVHLKWPTVACAHSRI